MRRRHPGREPQGPHGDPGTDRCPRPPGGQGAGGAGAGGLPGLLRTGIHHRRRSAAPVEEGRGDPRGPLGGGTGEPDAGLPHEGQTLSGPQGSRRRGSRAPGLGLLRRPRDGGEQRGAGAGGNQPGHAGSGRRLHRAGPRHRRAHRHPERTRTAHRVGRDTGLRRHPAEAGHRLRGAAESRTGRHHDSRHRQGPVRGARLPGAQGRGRSPHAVEPVAAHHRVRR